jgi:hypothetical protein
MALPFNENRGEAATGASLSENGAQQDKSVEETAVSVCESRKDDKLVVGTEPLRPIKPGGSEPADDSREATQGLAGLALQEQVPPLIKSGADIPKVDRIPRDPVNPVSGYKVLGTSNVAVPKREQPENKTDPEHEDHLNQSGGKVEEERVKKLEKELEEKNERIKELEEKCERMKELEEKVDGFECRVASLEKALEQEKSEKSQLVQQLKLIKNDRQSK